MEESLFKVILDYGSLGIMCAFLFYLHLQTTKRNDALSDRFTDQLNKLRDDSKAEEERIRERFMDVISKYDGERDTFYQERTQLRSNLAAKMSEMPKEAVSMSAKLDAIGVSIEGLANSLKSIEQENRLRELTRSKDDRG